MRAKIVCALGLTILAALIPQFLGESQYSEGPCFVFPEGTKWSLGSLGYHHGCEDNSCTPLSPIAGYDYITAKGVPILAPFDGVVSEIGKDGLDNTYLKFQNEERTWEMGFLHAKITARQFQGYKTGEQLALNDAIGNANGIPHPHLWFRNIKTNSNTPDHDQFWSCLGSKPKPPTEPPIDNIFEEILKWIADIIDQIKNFFSGGTPPVDEPPDTKPPKIYEFRISHQKPDNLIYQYNIRVFFAWVSSGYNLERMEKMDLENFVGSVEIKPGKTSVNDIFGTKDYEEGQGMKPPPGFGIGDGACHTASMVAYVLASEGLFVECDDPSHRLPIPGVPEKWNCTVCIPTAQYPCGGNKEKDIHINNQNVQLLGLSWQIEGDYIRLWVDKNDNIPPSNNLKWLLIVVGLIFLIFLIWIIFFRKSDKTGHFLLGIADNLPLIKRIARDVIEESKNWFVALLVVILLLPGIYKDIITYGFSDWFRGQSLLGNWTILLLGILIIGNFLFNSFMRSKYPTKYVFVGKESKWNIFWLILGAVYLTSSVNDKYPTLINVLVIGLLFVFALPSKYKQGCLRYGCIFLVIIMIVPVIGAVFGVIVINQAIDSLWEKIMENELIQRMVQLIELLEKYFGWDIPFPKPPTKDGPYGDGNILSLKELFSALIQSGLQQPKYENIRQRYDAVVEKSKRANYDPALSMSIWIEESGASYYEKYPGVADFGCISKTRQNFDIQFACWLELWDKYSKDNMFKVCRGPDDLLSLREFLLIYEGGYRSCRDGNFVVEPGFPDRIKKYYEVVTGGGNLDF